MSNISQEQKGEIASEFIKQAPPGEFKEVLSDVRTLVHDDDVLRVKSVKAFQEYNESMFLPCKVSKNEMSLVTPYAKNGEKYVDYRNGVKFAFDHIRQEPEDQEACEIDSNLKTYFNTIDEEIVSYTKEYFKSANSAVYLSGSCDSFKITICIESHAYSPNNFWNGLFKSHYVIDSNKLSITGSIFGTIHYYEDGNVQLHSTKEVTGTIKSFKEPKDLAASIANFIKSEEQKYQEAIINDTGDMMDATFKALRRALPVTRTKIDWSKVGAYTLASELTK